ncbi:hypothetical protein [Gemmatimonas sp.]|jgi:acyl-CoA synthetase (AMP-forming)/AMP-acid ligase II|uniref:hypothetical protein n=1 Tax=Gemmatimonas sp. TaxID=1962908 RepID=UPI0031C06F4E|nr:hypothetical protein [Gemmatimonas sp.]
MDPLALLPFAIAAGGGRIGPLAASQLVAAGTTLLQRSAPLVRALAGRRAGILLPNVPAWLLALAASDGREAVVLDIASSGEELAAQCHTLGIGAVFTTRTLSSRLPGLVTRVLLDDAPATAYVILADREQTVDLGSHYGLDLIGDTGVEGSNEPCLHFPLSATSLSHRDALAAARTAMAMYAYTPVDRTLTMTPFATPSAVIHGLVAPLLAGGLLHLREQLTTPQCRTLIEHDDVTMLVGTASTLGDLALGIRGAPLAHSALKRVVCVARDSTSALATEYDLQR